MNYTIKLVNPDPYIKIEDSTNEVHVYEDGRVIYQDFDGMCWLYEGHPDYDELMTLAQPGLDYWRYK